MRTLMFLVVLFVVGIVGVGFYRGWFQFSADTKTQRPSATITMDKDKIHADEQKAKDEMQEFRQAAKEKTGQWADKAK
jgi:predicted negative regulator of RcsB-dependent stress response